MNANDILYGQMMLDSTLYGLVAMYLGETKVWPIDDGPSPESPPEINPEDTIAGDVLYTHNTGDLFFSDGSLETAQSAYGLGYTPVGVVVVPGTHNVYGDGSCGVMSLREMDCNAPDTGNSVLHPQVQWGHYGNDIPDLPNLNQVSIGNQINGLPTGEIDYAIMPSNTFSEVQCLHDTDAYYSSSYLCTPSPYLTDGSRNPGYYQTTSPSSSNNTLADFDGKGNSKILWDLATAQSDWRTASTITNNSGNNYLPAACCCWRYHTKGTEQSDWYLPACGELGYIMPLLGSINEVITNLRNVYGRTAGNTLDTAGYYWSSSEYGSNDARIVNTYSGGVDYIVKNVGHYVRAFLRINKKGIISGSLPS